MHRQLWYAKYVNRNILQHSVLTIECEREIETERGIKCKGSKKVKKKQKKKKIADTFLIFIFISLLRTATKFVI